MRFIYTNQRVLYTIGFGIVRAKPNLKSWFPYQLSWLAKYGWINRLHWSEWDEATSQLSAKPLKSPLKLVVVCEKHFNWTGGLVAAAIWLFRDYERRDPADARTLAEWVLQHRGRNPWIPFGNTSFARTMEEREEEF